MSDGRHKERKMTKTQVLWHFDKSLTKLTCQHVTKSDEDLSQRHDKFGAEKNSNILKIKKSTLKPTLMTGIYQLPN